MPTYEYVCKKCEARLEVFQRMTDPPKKRCPACRGTLQKVLSGGAGIIFKGSGFYTTDYRSDSYKKAAGAEKAGGGAEKKDAPAAPAAAPKSGGKKPAAEV